MKSTSDIINIVAKNTEFTCDQAKVAVDAVVDAIKDSLISGEEISMWKFGRFALYEQTNKCGYNIYKGEVIRVPRTTRIRFRPSRLLLRAVNADRNNNEQPTDTDSNEGFGMDEIDRAL